MKIKALVPFSNGTLSMEQYQVAEVTDTLGNQLIEAGVAIEIGGGGTGGGVLVVTETEGTLDKTWQEIHDAGFSILNDGGIICLLSYCGYDGPANAYIVNYIDISGGSSNFVYYPFSASTASDYPVRFQE